MMSPAELSDLIGDICERGLIEPIVKYEGLVLDGRNRLLACEKAGVKPKFREWNGEAGTPTAFVISQNLHRRHLSKAQIAAIGAEAMPLLELEAHERMSTSGRVGAQRRWGRHESATPNPSITNAGRTRQVASDQLGGAVSGMSIQRARAIKDAAPNVFDQLKSGDIPTISQGLAAAGLNHNGTRPIADDEVEKDKREEGRPYVVATKRQGELARKQKERLAIGLGNINGVLRGLSQIDFQMVAAVSTAEELAAAIERSNDLARLLKTIRIGLQGVEHHAQEAQQVA